MIAAAVSAVVFCRSLSPASAPPMVMPSTAIAMPAPTFFAANAALVWWMVTTSLPRMSLLSSVTAASVLPS